MTSNSLSYNILVTRPGHAGQQLCELITAQGGRAVHFPTIAFAPPSDENLFISAVQALGEQDWLIFNSPQAVTATVPEMRKAWPNFPDTVKFAAVGAGTAKALKDAGYIVTLFPENEWSSEGLLALPAFQSVQNQKVMIIRGARGREYLEKVFKERGAIVNSCIAYQRVLPEADTHACLHMLENNELSAVVAGSFESVNNLKLLLGEAGWQKLRELPLLVMSERIKILAAELGFQTIWVTNTASQQAVLDLISQQKEVLCLTSKKKQ